MDKQPQVEILDDSDETSQWPNAEMADLADYLIKIIQGLLDDDGMKIECSQDRSGLVFRIQFGDVENNRLFVGPQFRLVNAVLEVLRFQQHLKHNRYITIELVQSDGSVQHICNKRIFNKNKPELAESVQAQIQRTLNITSKRGQVRALRALQTFIGDLLHEVNNG